MVMTKQQIEKLLHTDKIPADFLTRKEWEQHLGICKDSVLSLLNKLNNSGMLNIQKKRVQDLSGRSLPVTAYQISNPVSAKKGTK